MKNKPWRILEWGSKNNDGTFKTSWLSLDNRVYKPGTTGEKTSPLLRMDVSERYSEEELRAYLVQIRDALNSCGIIEGTIEDTEQTKPQ